MRHLARIIHENLEKPYLYPAGKQEFREDCKERHFSDRALKLYIRRKLWLPICESVQLETHST